MPKALTEKASPSIAMTELGELDTFKVPLLACLGGIGRNYSLGLQ